LFNFNLTVIQLYSPLVQYIILVKGGTGINLIKKSPDMTPLSNGMMLYVSVFPPISQKRKKKK